MNWQRTLLVPGFLIIAVCLANAQYEAQYAINIHADAAEILELVSVHDTIKFKMKDGDKVYTYKVFEDIDNNKYQKLIAFIRDPWSLKKDDKDAVMQQYDQIAVELEQMTVAEDATGLGLLGSKRTTASSVPSGGIGLSQSDLIWALTETLISRAKEELAVAFFVRIDSFMNDPILAIDDVTLTGDVLFPNFNLILDQLASRDISQWSNSVRTSLAKDLLTLPDNIHQISRENGSLQWVLYNWAYNVQNGIRNEQPVSNILAKFKPGVVTYSDTDLRNIMGFMTGVNAGLLSTESNKWIESEQLEDLFGSGRSLNYLGSLFFNSQSNQVYMTQLWPDLAGGLTAEKQSKVMELLFQLSSSFQGVSKVVNKKTLGKRDIMRGATTVLGLVSATVDLTALAENDKQKILRGLEISGAGLELSQAIANVLGKDEAGQNGQNNTMKNYASIALEVLSLFDLLIKEEDRDEIYDQFVKYLTLFADVAQAESGDEVKEILETAILPVGSYRIKRSTMFSSSIGSLPGVTGGNEWVYYDGDAQDAAAFGGYMPIGVDLSWSGGDEEGQKSVFSVYFNVLDLGNLLSYRVNNGEISGQAPEVRFEDVFAPGLYLNYGLKNTPVNFGAGGQLAAKLRDFQEGEAVIDDQPTFALRAFVAVDIPMFTLAVKGRKAASSSKKGKANSKSKKQNRKDNQPQQGKNGE